MSSLYSVTRNLYNRTFTRALLTTVYRLQTTKATGEGA
jgi:hypothetical protein